MIKELLLFTGALFTAFAVFELLAAFFLFAERTLCKSSQWTDTASDGGRKLCLQGAHGLKLQISRLALTDPIP